MQKISKFDSLFFGSYIGSDTTIESIFHRHFLVIFEDILLWGLFWLIIPSFLYYNDVFGMKEGIPSLVFYMYILFVYAVIMYKLFDWYTHVWIMTESTIIDMQWKVFAPNILYIPYDKIEGIEIRTPSWLAWFLRMSDVVVKLAWQEEFVLPSASKVSTIVESLQKAGKTKKHQKEEDKEPFDILVDTLADVVKWHLVSKWKTYITRDYVEVLDSALHEEGTIDLREEKEKIVIEAWKEKYDKKGEENIDEDEHHH